MYLKHGLWYCYKKTFLLFIKNCNVRINPLANYYIRFNIINVKIIFLIRLALIYFLKNIGKKDDYYTHKTFNVFHLPINFIFFIKHHMYLVHTFVHHIFATWNNFIACFQITRNKYDNKLVKHKLKK